MPTNPSTKTNEFGVKFTSSFKAIRVMGETLEPVWFDFSAEIFPLVPVENKEFRFGIEKLKFWITQIVDQGILFSVDNEWAADAFISKCSNTPILCPFDPLDETVALLLNSKANAFGRDCFTAGYIEIDSENDSSLTISYVGLEPPNLPTGEEWFGDFSHFSEPWWNRDDSSTFDFFPEDEEDANNIPSCFFKLDFLREKNGDQLADVIKPVFKPKIIEGNKRHHGRGDS